MFAFLKSLKTAENFKNAEEEIANLLSPFYEIIQKTASSDFSVVF